MTTRKFVEAIKGQTKDAAVNGTIACFKGPPGRRQRERLARLAAWYKQLSPDDQNMLSEALAEAAEMAVFEFLCVLDGVSVIENTQEKGGLELFFVKSSERTRLNEPCGEELHNIFNGLHEENIRFAGTSPDVKPYDSGRARELKAKLRPGDGLHIHHVPDKHAGKAIDAYDPDTAPAIALPKSEHSEIGRGADSLVER